MATTLLDAFLSQECDSASARAHLRSLFEEELANTTRVRHEFNFNCFDVTIERSDASVTIEEILDVGEAGTQIVPLSEFLHALNRSTA